MTADSIPIVDCHAHFLDAQLNRYPIFEQRSLAFEALVGDYSSLPRRYLPEDYLKDANGLSVVQTIMAEFISSDPVSEVEWAENLSERESCPQGIIALIDFLDPDFERLLDHYSSLLHVRAIRQHLAWHPTNPLIRFATRPDILTDKVWQERLSFLRTRDLCCEIEILVPQLPDLAAVAISHSDLQFILPLMGWPIDLTEGGHLEWKRNMKALSMCPNVAVKIFGMECIFGINWKIDQMRAWVLETIDFFGPERCMFGSHMPIAKLACSFQNLYGAYFDVVSEFSASEKRKLFHDTAITVYKLSSIGETRHAWS